jgi:hypothetical protein
VGLSNHTPLIGIRCLFSRNVTYLKKEALDFGPYSTTDLKACTAGYVEGSIICNTKEARLRIIAIECYRNGLREKEKGGVVTTNRPVRAEVNDRIVGGGGGGPPWYV